MMLKYFNIDLIEKKSYFIFIKIITSKCVPRECMFVGTHLLVIIFININ